MMQERIVARLTAALDPIVLDVVDESDRHAGHAGARKGGGTHYRVRVVSTRSNIAAGSSGIVWSMIS